MFISAAELLRVTSLGSGVYRHNQRRRRTRGPFLLHSAAEAAHQTFSLVLAPASEPGAQGDYRESKLDECRKEFFQ